MNKRMKLFIIPLAAVSLASCGGPDVPGVSTTIQMWTGFGQSMTTQLETILETYSSEHEGVDVVHTGQGGYDNLLANIVGSVSTRTYPNIAVAYPDHMAQYQESGILFDLTNYIAQDGVDLNKYYQNYLTECQEIVDGKTLGLPFNKSTEVLTTNQTFVDLLIKMTANESGENKITAVPTTWQEVETFGKAALNILDKTGAFNKVIGVDGNVYADAAAAGKAEVDVAIDLTSVDKSQFRVLSYDSQSNFFITAVRQWGGTYTSVETLPNGNTQGYMEYKSEETVEMLNFFYRLFDEQIIGIPSDFNESSYTSTPFKAFKTIFTIGSSAGVSNCVPSNDGNAFDITINPIPYNADRPDCKYVISQGTNLVMFRNTGEVSRRETWNLLKELSYDAETNAQFAKQTGYIPVTKDAYNSTSYQEYLNDTSLTGTAKTMRDAINTNFDVYLGDGSSWIQFVDPGFVGSSSIRANVGNIMTVVRDDAVNDALSGADATAYWNAKLDEWYSYNPNNIKK